uniref:TYRO protein tyrosine kinase-binding protein n=1 Tax=Ornithorhynchus anatinus TaxID=9258 RepID=A0A6I8N242_ORNAN
MEPCRWLPGLILVVIVTQGVDSADDKEVCQNCIEVDPVTLIGIIMGDILATGLLALGVFCMARHEGRPLSSASDQRSLMANDQLYQVSVRPGRPAGRASLRQGDRRQGGEQAGPHISTHTYTRYTHDYRDRVTQRQTDRIHTRHQEKQPFPFLREGLTEEGSGVVSVSEETPRRHTRTLIRLDCEPVTGQGLSLSVAELYVPRA